MQPVSPPAFNLAVRFGSLEPTSQSPFEHGLLNRAVSVRGEIGSRWGGRGYGSPGDEWIDLSPPGNRTASRKVGAPGLALPHVIGRDAMGRNQDGAVYELDRPTFGLVVPEGGPTVLFVVADPDQEG